MDNFTHLKDNCFCLPSCYDIQYSSTERQILQFDGKDCYNENFDINAKESYLNYTPGMEIMIRSSKDSYEMGIYQLDNLIDSFGKTLEMLDSIEFKNKANGALKGIHRKKNLFSKHC